MGKRYTPRLIHDKKTGDWLLLSYRVAHNVTKNHQTISGVWLTPELHSKKEALRVLKSLEPSCPGAYVAKHLDYLEVEDMKQEGA